MTVNVLGRDYEVIEHARGEDPLLKENNLDGYCDESIARVVVESMQSSDVDSFKDLERHKKRIKRHELIHAFLSESGLHGECYWASEEMVDWLSYQFPKMVKAFGEADCL